jgi:hypothetical protein
VLDPATHLQAVQAGEHEIENHEIRAKGLAERNPADAVTRYLDVEALGPKASGDGVRDRRLVLDHRYAAAHAAQITARVSSSGGGFVEVSCRYGSALDSAT